MEVVLRDVTPLRDGFADQFQRFRLPVLLQCNQAQQMQCIGMRRIGRQHLAIEQGGLIQLPRLMQAHSVVE